MTRPRSPHAQSSAIFGRRFKGEDGSASDRAARARPFGLEVWREDAGGFVLLQGHYTEQACVIAAEQRGGIVRVIGPNGRIVGRWKNGRRS